MNDIVVGIVAWVGIIAFMAWLYLFVKMVIMREPKRLVNEKPWDLKV